jgi:hypothetical protein
VVARLERLVLDVALESLVHRGRVRLVHFVEVLVRFAVGGRRNKNYHVVVGERRARLLENVVCDTRSDLEIELMGGLQSSFKTYTMTGDLRSSCARRGQTEMAE